MIGWGALLMEMIEACKYISERDGISVELFDLQTVMPFDEETIINSFLHLEAPIQKVTGFDTPNGLIYEPIFMPNRFRMYEAVKKCIDY